MKQTDAITTKKNIHGYFLIVLSVSFASFMVRLNNYMVNVSLPAIAENFNAGTGQASRIIMAYLLVITSTLLLFGKLGDRIGLKKIFILGYSIFVCGSFLCGFSNGIYGLISARSIQGLGGSMLLATSFAIISKFLPREKTGWAFGITSTASALGVATGAPLGGIITGYLSWHWIFFINVPIGIIAIWVALKKIPEEKKALFPAQQGSTAQGSLKERFDIWGAVLSFGSLFVLLYGFNMGKEWGWGSFNIMICFITTALLLTLFFFREKTFESPLLDLSLFKNARFSLALCATFMAYLLISGNAFLMPFYLKTVKGLTAQETGMVLMVYSLIYVLMSSTAGRLADRISPVKLCTAAMMSATLNTFIFAFTLRFGGLLFSLMYLIWMAFSFVFFFSPNNKQVMGCAPKERHGVASGVFNTITNLSMVFGVALFEAVFSQFSGSFTTVFNLSHTALLNGFNAAYVLGGFVCAAALLFSLFIRGIKSQGH